MNTINPYTGETVAVFEELSQDQINEKLAISDQAFLIHKSTSYQTRAERMLKIASLLKSKKTHLAKVITTEMGKLLRESEAEIEKCALVCEYYATHAEAFLTDELIETNAIKSFVSYEPLGAVLAVMPWNFPFWQVFRFAAPAVMAGNVGVLKHASNVPQCALEIEKLFTEAGFEQGVFQTLLMSSKQVAYVIQHKTIKAVTLTGSEEAGSKVAAAAGKAIKKTVLELGGSDPFLLLDDADVPMAVDVAVKARFRNCGQSCIAAKRFIIPKKLKREFLALFMEKVEDLKIGDPLDKTTDIGPMARLDLLEQLDQQVDDSVAQGAVVITGGASYDPDKCLYTPTILADVVKGMPAYDEELFGPVASVLTYDSLEEGIRLANDTEYGLGASIWTKDMQKGEEVARQIEAGAVFVNGMVTSDPRLPFGGIKLSGYGRELSYLGIREFVNQKTIVIAN